MVQSHLLNGAALAYIGDAVYEVAIRQHLIESGETQPNILHKLAVKYVGALGQAKVIKAWLAQDDFLSSQEIEMYKRGRNNKAHTKAKNASIGDYRQATGFESLIGWLYLSQQQDRLNELITTSINYIDETERKKS